MRKMQWSLAVAGLMGAALLSACSASNQAKESTAAQSDAQSTQAQSGAESMAESSSAAEGGAAGEGKSLVLSTFGLSEDVSAEEVYKPFEEKFGAKIVTETGTTSERYTKLASDPNSPIDVIELSQALTAKGYAAGLFEDIDLSKLSNAADLIDPVKKFAEAGNGVAYTVNSIGIIYDPEVVGFEIKSYDDLWKAELKDLVAIPDISSTFGPAVMYVASEHKGVDISTDDGKAAFEALEELKPNLVKSYSKSSDLVNMFTSGEVGAAIVGNFAVPNLKAANDKLVYYTPEGTYANFNIISINKNSKNKELAYEYLNYRLSPELQEKSGLALNEAPTNKKVQFTEEQAANMTYGDTAAKAKFVDYNFVNPLLDQWIDQWNRLINS